MGFPVRHRKLWVVRDDVVLGSCKGRGVLCRRVCLFCGSCFVWLVGNVRWGLGYIVAS